jgi:GDPmannose 4,6-dehydratase
MWMMLQAEKADDYLVATGSGATIREMLEFVCGLAELDPDEVYEADQRFMRPSEVPFLLGNPSKIRDELGWEPQYSWRALLEEMYRADLDDLFR